MKKVKLDGHRGSKALYPENTLIGFKKALESDIDMLEIDLHMTSDGEIIMMHDHTVDRTTDGTGYIKDKTLAEIRSLDAGIYMGEEYRGTKVPLFTEFLEMMKSRPDIELCVELKDYPHDRGQDAFISCDKSIKYIEEYGFSDRVIINSWSGEILTYVAKKYNGKYRLHGYYPMFLNEDNYDKDELYKLIHCVCMFNFEMIDGKKVRKADQLMPKEDFDYVKSLGLEPWVYFKPDSEELFKKAYEYGAVAFTCDDVVFAEKTLKKLKLR